MKVIKRIFCLLLAAVTVFSFSGCTDKDGRKVEIVSHSDNKTVFKLGDMKCSIPEAKLYLMNTKNNYNTISGIDIWNGDFDTDVIASSIKSMALSHLTKVYTLCTYAEQNEIKLSDTDRMMVRSAAAEYLASLSADELEYFGITEKELIEIYTRYALAIRANDALMNTVDEEVSDDEARVMSAMIIYTKDKSKADTVAEKLKQGAKFENQASANNELDSYNVTFSRGTYPSAVEDVIFNLDEKKSSDMIEAEDGYYFFYITNKYLEENSEENKQVIREKRKQETFEKTSAEIEEKIYSDINQNVWNSLDPKGNNNVTTNSMFTVLERYMSE